MGKDLGGAIKGFKEGMKEGTDSAASPDAPKVADANKPAPGQTIDVQAKEKS
jgi:sec-independent protein translocase protein TatA